jgi:hypothetical protein
MEFRKGKKSPCTLENARMVIRFLELMGTRDDLFGGCVLVRRSKIVKYLVKGEGEELICPTCSEPDSPSCLFSRLISNENTLNRLLKQLTDAKILRRRERRHNYPRSSPFKEKKDVFYQIDGRIYTKVVTLEDEIKWLKDEGVWYIRKLREEENKYRVACDLLRGRGMKNPEAEITELTKDYKITIESAEDLEKRLSEMDPFMRSQQD